MFLPMPICYNKSKMYKWKAMPIFYLYNAEYNLDRENDIDGMEWLCYISEWQNQKEWSTAYIVCNVQRHTSNMNALLVLCQ